jgi:hypothetical protein
MAESVGRERLHRLQCGRKASESGLERVEMGEKCVETC